MGKFKPGQKITDNGLLQFGYYLGEHISAIPELYLKWMALYLDVEEVEYRNVTFAAQKECDRRGITATKPKETTTDVATDPA